MLEKLSGQALTVTVDANGIQAFPTAAQAQVDHVFTTKGSYFELYQTTAQTLMPVWLAGSGLELALDQVNNEAVEYVLGGNNAQSPFAFVAGTDPDFFLRTRWKITDKAGMDQAIFAGFRKQEAFAVPTSILSAGDGIYTDFFGVGCADGTGTDVFTASDLNNGGSTTVTDTLFNLTDAEVVDFEVRVRGRVAKVYINGVQLGDPVAFDGDGTAITSQATKSVASFTFDDGDTLVPFIFLRQDAGVGTTFLREIECGLLRDKGLDKNAENRGE
jgi:hypothetical protein